ncbi:MAG: alpha/beta fold hydrolase [Pontibacterium sp.]
MNGHHIRYAIYRACEGHADTGRRMLMLHGAGVAGELTWEGIIGFLTQWDEILVPDFRGAGETVSEQGDELPYTLAELGHDVVALLEHVGWQSMDLAGYSMGGLVSMLVKAQWSGQVNQQFLLESAGLERKDFDEALNLRKRYQTAVSALKSDDVDQGVVAFLDIISPKRKVSAAVERITIDRLGHRPQGFAHALDAVTHCFNGLDRDSLLAAQGEVLSFVGANSPEGLHEFQAHLVSSRANWQSIEVRGTDHSLPYQKPRQIAQHMNQAVSVV